MVVDGLEQSRALMEKAGVGSAAIAAFAHSYRQLARGETGLLREDDLEPVIDLPRLDDLDIDPELARTALAATVVVKLNGGLGTSMGMDRAKSLLPVRPDRTFLDIIAEQVLELRHRFAVPLPITFMNSFRTSADTMRALARYLDLAVDGIPLEFRQNREPKLRADDLTPVHWPADPDLEWCPPGHGDVYLSLARTGLLDALRDIGIRYAFLSNADNLGATCDPDIAAWLLREQVPYLAEVCTRTVNDRKGGHLARRLRDGRIVLRDNAMVAPGEEHFFADETRHATFHANNLWVDLDVVARMLDERHGVLGLPIIVNRKTVDPTDKTSTQVIQIECAMGTAIEAIDGSRAMHVPRSRFRPVKTTNELALVRSDLFRFEPDWRVAAATDRPDPLVDLGPAFALAPDFERRFASGVPSLRECTSLRVRGDVTFGAGVVCRGDVLVQGPATIPDGAILNGELAPALEPHG